MRGSVLEIFTVCILLLSSVVLLSSALAGYLMRRLNILERFILISFITGLLVLSMHPSKINFMVAGIIVIALMVMGVVKQIGSRITREKLLIEKTSEVVKKGVNTNDN